MISIVGAGPVGNYLAYLLARKKERVEVYEEHSTIGRPVHCTGLVTDAITNLMPLRKEFVLNKINLAKIVSPNGAFTEIKMKDNFVLDRPLFDKYLANKAQDLGANYHLNSKFISCTQDKDIKLKIKQNEHNITKKTNVLVGADGYSSQVAKAAGISRKNNFLIGVQARTSMEVNKDVIEFWLGYGEFAWVVPESNNIARIGVASRSNPNAHLKRFYDKIVKKGKTIEYQSGIIPFYDPNLRIQKGNIFLVGDAATQVKATTGGGIIPGMAAARILSGVLLSKKGDYTKLIKKTVGKELKYDLLMRRMLNNFNNDDYNDLVRMFSKPQLKEILTIYNRDNTSRFIFKLFWREPRLLKYIFKLI